MAQPKPLDLLVSTARSGWHHGLRVGQVVVRRAGAAAVTGLGRARDAVEEQRARRRPAAASEPGPARTPAPAETGNPDTPPPASPGPGPSAPSPVDVARRVPRHAPTPPPEVRPAPRPRSSSPGAKLPPRRRQQPGDGG